MSNFYYNGVLLPELPADILAEYPNVFIYKWADGTIDFMAAPAPNKWYYYSSDQQIRLEECTYKRYVYNAESDAWEFKKDHTDNGRWGTNSSVGSVIWTNNTIPSGSVDSTTAWMPRCCAYEPALGKIEYNGVMLPFIPLEHIETNPYIWIRQNGSTGYYDLVMGADCWYYNSGLYCTSSATIYYYRVPIESAGSATEWEFYEETTGSFGVDGARPVLWSLQDVSSSIYSTDVYFAGTDLLLPAVPTMTKYLIRDKGIIYTVVDNALVNVTAELNSALFIASGTDDIPSGLLLMELTEPEVLCWTNADVAPRLTATVQGTVAGTHDIISDDIEIGHHSIFGVTSVEADASELTQFFLSFDGGLWMIYDTSIDEWVASEVGMTASELIAVPKEGWDIIVNNNSTMKLKAVLEGVATVTQVKLNFNNEPPIMQESEG